MNNILGQIVLVLFFATPGLAADWTEVGNGGDAVICKQTRQFHMYDAYEASHRYALPPQIPPFTLPAPRLTSEGFPDYGEEIYLDASLKLAVQILADLEPLDKSRYEIYRQWVQEFKSESRFIGNAEFFDIPDTGIGFIPPGCELHQLIVQRAPLARHERRYRVAMDYWRLLPPEQQVVGILHEVIYRGAVEQNPTLKTSEPVRYFNALLIAGEFSKMSKDEYRNLVFSLFGDVVK